MKNYDWKYIFKKVVIFFIIFAILSFVKSCKVNAATVSGCIDSGQSLSGIAKIGANYVGSSYFYETAPQTWSQKALTLSFCTDLQDYPSLTGKDKIYFTVDYCVNGGQPDFAIYSSYYNDIDYTYYTGQSIYLAEGEWSKAYCYRSFIKLRLNYSSNVGTGNYNFTTYTNDNNTFALYGFENYNKLSRYTDLVYYNSEDYNNALYNAKQIGNQNTIINQNTQINNSINDVNNSINDDNVSGAESQVNDLLNNSSFQDNSGIQSIITAPLNFIQGLTNTCSPISLTIPFINTNVTIPCMKQELTTRVPTVVPILSTIINGFIIYRILLDIVAIVKSAREPDEDRIEVLDL